MADEGDRSKSATAPLVLPAGDRAIVDNQMRALRNEFREAKSERAAFEAGLDEKLDRAKTRSNIAIGMALSTLVLSAIRLYLTYG